jgi:hypothetical protein
VSVPSWRSGWPGQSVDVFWCGSFLSITALRILCSLAVESFVRSLPVASLYFLDYSAVLFIDISE